MNSARTERYKDLLLATLLAMVGIGGFVFVNPTGAEIMIGPGGLSWRTLPFIYSALLLGLVALFALSTLLDLWLIERGEEPRSLLGERPAVARDRVADLRRVTTLACLFGYAAALDAFGFVIATFLLLFAMLRVLGRRNHWKNLLVSLVGTLLFWLLFIEILKLPIQGRLWDPLTPWLNALYVMTGAR